MTRLLVVDNYDSFVHTLDAYLRQLGAATRIVPNDALDPAQLERELTAVDGVVVSPGPGAPASAGASVPIVRASIAVGAPLLGVCLGHQAIAAAAGGVVSEAGELVHGRVSRIRHDGSALFAGIPQGFSAMRYHSLAVDDAALPAEIVVTARTDDGTVMALRHASAPVTGVQFHPESVLTEHGHRLLANWLASLGDAGAVARSEGLGTSRRSSAA